MPDTTSVERAREALRRHLYQTVSFSYATKTVGVGSDAERDLAGFEVAIREDERERTRVLEEAVRSWFNARHPADEGELVLAMDRALAALHREESAGE